MQSKLLSIKYSIILIISLFFFSLLGFTSYKGSAFYYFVFDLIWLTLLMSSLSFFESYIFFYLKIMLFLGVWLKLMFYLVLSVEFLEPTGYWKDVQYLGSYWDNALMVASYAALGILTAEILFYFYRRFFLSNNDVLLLKKQTEVPKWYLYNSIKVWRLLLFISLLISCINFKTHFYMVGLAPGVIFPFHINFLLSWILIFLFPLLIAYLMGLDALAQNCKNWYYAIFIANLISMAVLSRSIALFWIVPCFFILLKDSFYSQISKYKKLIITSIFMTILSLIAVSGLRSYLYTSYSLDRIPSTKRLQSQFQQLMSLPIRRWIGIEGVLATTAYPHTGWDLFKKAIFQKPTQKVSIYSKVSLSYLKIKKGMNFSSLPGLIGILNYSNSYKLVCFGTFIICLLISSIQFFCYRLGLNAYFLSQQGFLLAFFLTELNIPYLGVINFFEYILVSFLLLFMHNFNTLFQPAMRQEKAKIKGALNNG